MLSFFTGIRGQIILPLALIAGVFLFRLLVHTRKTGSKFGFGQFNFGMYVFAGMMLTLSLAAALRYPGQALSSDSSIVYGRITGHTRYEQYGHEMKMLRHPTELTFHFRVIRSLQEANEKNTVARIFNFFDAYIQPAYFYERLKHSKHPALRDAGYFGEALLSLNDHQQHASALLNRISDTDQSSLHLAKALISQDAIATTAHLEQEIRNQANVEDAVPMLADIYYRTNNYSGLFLLSNEKSTAPYLPGFYRTFLSLETQKGIRKIPVMMKNFFRNVNKVQLLVSAAVFLLFIFFIRYFSTESLLTLLVFGTVSCIFFMIVTPATYDLLHRRLEFRQNGEALNDFAYFAAGIGLTEEILKLLPFLAAAFVLFRKKDPATYFSFASASAIAFSFAESIMNADSAAYASFGAHSIWLTLMHLSSTGICVYILCVAVFKQKKNPALWIIPAICLATLVHGLYDYCMASDNWIVAFLILISGIAAYGSMLSNTISNSTENTTFIQVNYSRLSSALLGLILFIMTAEFLANWKMQEFYPANALLKEGMLSLSVPLALFIIRTAQTDVIPGKWQPLHLFTSLNPFPFLFRQHVDYSTYIGKHILVSGARMNSSLLRQLPLTGVITQREVISGYAGWFTMELDRPLMVSRQSYRYAKFRMIAKNSPITETEHTGAALYVADKEKDSDELIFIDWILISEFRKS